MQKTEVREDHKRAFEKVVERIQNLFVTAGIKYDKPEFVWDVDVFEKSGTPLPGVDFGGWGIQLVEYVGDKAERESGMKPRVCWLITKSTIIPGVRYTPNGDGYPDDVDVADIEYFELSDDWRAATKFFRLYVQDKVDNAVDDVGITETAEEAQREENAQRAS